jgi:diaminopimelate epimerase
MAGGGNDFVIIDNRDGRVTDPAGLTRRICTRALSVGADGLILVENSPNGTFRMRYYNSDGSLADFCANGTRCVARFAYLNGIAPKRMHIDTDAGLIGADIGEGNLVTLSLAPPRGFVRERPLAIEGKNVRGSFLVVGVPHYVMFVDENIWEMDIVPMGRALRRHPDLLPDGANVNFVSVRGPGEIDVRTYERGVEGETLSCGSGVVASTSVSALFGKVKSPVSVRTRSGIVLEVAFHQKGEELHDVTLTGDARLVFRSSMTPETIEGFDPEFVRDPAQSSSKVLSAK